MVHVNYTLLVLGAGGTGTYFLKEASRYIASLLPSKGCVLRNSLFIMDGDIVEKKNLDRQAFTSEDIGFKKSSRMAELLNETFFVDSNAGKYLWHSIPQYLTDVRQLDFLKADTLEDLQRRDPSSIKSVNIPLIISCVDNHAARLVLEEYFNNSYNCILFDSANEWENGECVFAYKINNSVIAPPRSFYFPDIKEGDIKAVTEMSCTELNSVSPQHIFTNMYAAIQLLSQFATLIETGTFKCGYSVFNQRLLTNEFYEKR